MWLVFLLAVGIRHAYYVVTCHRDRLSRTCPAQRIGISTYYYCTQTIFYIFFLSLNKRPRFSETIQNDTEKAGSYLHFQLCFPAGPRATSNWCVYVAESTAEEHRRPAGYFSSQGHVRRPMSVVKSKSKTDNRVVYGALGV